MVLRHERKDAVKCKASVVIPVYNTTPYLQDCLKSVMNRALQERREEA